MGRRVLYVAAKQPESLPIDDHDDIVYREILKNILFHYSDSASDLISYFMVMRDFQPNPDVIIVEFLHTFFDYTNALDTNDRLHMHFIESHMLITASVYGVVDAFSRNKESKFISIVSIDSSFHYIYQRFIQTFVDLYYYKENAIFTSINNLMEFIAEFKTNATESATTKRKQIKQK